MNALTKQVLNSYKGYVFDLSGVLIDFGVKVPFTAMSNAFKKNNIPITNKMIHFAIGREETKYIETICKIKHNSYFIKSVTKEFNNQLIKLNHINYYTTPIHGAVELTHKLKKKGKVIGITTNYTRNVFNIIKPELDKHGLLYDKVICSDDVKYCRPEPLMLYALLDELNLAKNDCIKIGESYLSLCEAYNANIDNIAVIDSSMDMSIDECEFEDLCIHSQEFKRLNLMQKLILYPKPKYYVNNIQDINNSLTN
jgi:phosphonoacetaldehyde hydrolase